MKMVPNAKDSVCKGCGKPKELIILNPANKAYECCGCNKVENFSNATFGKIEYTVDGCRWIYLDKNELILDCTTYNPKKHRKYFSEFHKAERERLVIIRNNLMAHKKAFKQKEQIKPLYGKTPGKRGMYKDKPCFIVGSGPSAKQDAELLKDAPGPILSINSSLKVLPKADWWLMGDYLKIVEEWFGAKLPIKPSEGAFFFGGSHESVLRYPWNRKVYFNFNNVGEPHNSTAGLVRHHLPKAFDIINGYESMFSALHIAYMWGCNPIVLVGADHCFNNEYHAGEGNENPKPHQAQYICDKYGQLKRTIAELILTAMYIEMEASFLNLAGVVVMDTSRGIIRNRVVNMPLAEVLDTMKRGYTWTACSAFRLSEDGEKSQIHAEIVPHKVGEKPKPREISENDMYGVGGSHGKAYDHHHFYPHLKKKADVSKASSLGTKLTKAGRKARVKSKKGGRK